MVTLTINGQEITVPAGTMLIEAAKRIGIEIPHYCYHPGLTIVASCRMCLVEVEGARTLVTSCSTPATEGMIVNTESDKVKTARADVLEFLLLDHPIDCPVCDCAGECLLQDYYFDHDLQRSRMEEPKELNVKAVPLSDKVNLDNERCILCSRCVRFCQEVPGTGELGVYERGFHSVLNLVDESKKLDNPYSGNVVDLCPVGALTDRDFRFTRRVWYLKNKPSICPECSRGCNITAWYDTDHSFKDDVKRVFRYKPRDNEEVNKYWICDHGRYSYSYVDNNRISFPMQKKDDKFEITSWDLAIEPLAELIKNAGPEKIAVISGTRAATEDFYALGGFFSGTLGIESIAVAPPPEDPGFADKILKQSDRSPNKAGAEIFGLLAPDGDDKLNEVVSKAEQGGIDILFIVESDLEEVIGEEKWNNIVKKVENIIILSCNFHVYCKSASWILPRAAFTERDGTFINYKKRLQKFRKAVEPLNQALADWEIYGKLADTLGYEAPYESINDIFAAVTEAIPALAGMTFRRVPATGISLRKKESETAARK
jgi:NADH-quinone oxidoreductase subunit G